MLLVASCAVIIIHLTSINCGCTSNAKLPVYSEEITEHDYTYKRLFVNKSIPIEVTFRVPVESSQLDDMEWYFGDKHLKIDTNHNNVLYYSVKPEQQSSTVTLHFRAPTSRISGKWNLVVTSPEKEQFASLCLVTSDAIIHRPHGAVRGYEGYPLSLTCAIDTYPPPTELKWRKVVFPSDGGAGRLEPVANVTYKEHEGLPNGVMEFGSSTGRSGFYLCTAISSGSEDNWLIEVRIKDYRTTLWPCLGIVIQLVLLAIIIGVHEYLEKKRHKAEDKQLKNN